jgi:hypothetical protein
MTTLVVEDGSIVPGANSYISLANAQTYWANWGYTSATIGTDTGAMTTALYQAAYAMDRLYGRFYSGKVAKNSPQTMLWPRQRYAHEEVQVFVQDPTGSGALLIACVIEGTITNIYVIEGGVNYTAPILTVGGMYSGTNTTPNPAVITANLTSGVITSTTIVSGGSGYISPREIVDNNGNRVNINQVPQAVLDGQCEMAVIALSNGVSALFPNEAEDRYIQQQIVELGVGANLRKQFFNKEATDIERYEGFRLIELRLWSVMNRQMVVTL